MTAPPASIPGSQPGVPNRNGRPEGKFYTHWRGRPLPVIPIVERDKGGRPPQNTMIARRGKCEECGCYPSAKKHLRKCLGLDIPPDKGNTGYSPEYGR
jgi:hypothetical protein